MRTGEIMVQRSQLGVLGNFGRLAAVLHDLGLHELSAQPARHAPMACVAVDAQIRLAVMAMATTGECQLDDEQLEAIAKTLPTHVSAFALHRSCSAPHQAQGTHSPLPLPRRLHLPSMLLAASSPDVRGCGPYVPTTCHWPAG